MMTGIRTNRCMLLLIALVVFGLGTRSVSAETSPSPSVLFVPLIGITSVPEPLALPKGPGEVTYHFAVKNFLQEVGLRDVTVTDDTCGPVVFVEGDDNSNAVLDFSETWRYTCTTEITATTNSTATAAGVANNISAVHRAYASVVVGSSIAPPLVSIINITKVSYPLSLPVGGGELTYTYRVTNPGVMALSNVSVTDDTCVAMSGELGDTNGNELLDINEAWTYTCTMNLEQTTTNTATVSAYANGLRAVGYATITVTVATVNFPSTGTNPDVRSTGWGILLGILAALVAYYYLFARGKMKKAKK